MPRKMRIRRSSAAMADDPYTLIVALDAQVWGGEEGSRDPSVFCGSVSQHAYNDDTCRVLLKDSCM